MFQPLKGIKVVELTLAGAGPAAGRILTSYGAESIWVEPLSGNSTRTIHENNLYSAGKSSLTLNLKSEKGIEIMYKLLKDADVFLTNYRYRSVERLGLGYEKLHELNPRLVYGCLTGWGLNGPLAAAPGFDTVCFWARGGGLIDFAEKDSLLVPPVAVGDIATAEAMVMGICAALYSAKVTGEGCRVDTSILEQAVWLNHDALIEVQYGEKYPKSRKSPRRAFLNTYQCKDGKWVVISSTYFDRHFEGIMRAIGREDLIGDPRWTCIEDTMYKRAPEMVEILDEGFAKMTQDEAVAALQAIDLAVERVQQTADVLKDPQVLENQYLIPWKDKEDGREYLMPAAPCQFNGTALTELGDVPKLGGQSTAILKELGYDDDAISALLAEHVTSN